MSFDDESLYQSDTIPMAAVGQSEPGSVGLTTGDFAAAIVAQYPSLLQVARRLMRSDQDARDLVQDALEHALRHRDKFRGTSVGGWLYAMMKHRFIDEQRRIQATLRLKDALRELALAGADSMTDPHVAEGNNEYVAFALALVDQESREILRLREVHSLSYREIAARLNISMSSVGVRLHRARSRLNEMMVRADNRHAIRRQPEAAFLRATGTDGCSVT